MVFGNEIEIKVSTINMVIKQKEKDKFSLLFKITFSTPCHINLILYNTNFITMKNLNLTTISLLIVFSFFAFFSTINAQTVYSTVVSSTDGYDVNISLTPHTIVAPNSCQWGYTFKVKIDYDITFTGSNIPNKLYTLQGNQGCGSISSSFFNLPNKGGNGMTLTANAWNPDSDCATATVESLLCNDLEVIIEGPGISYQTVNLSAVLPIELFTYDVKLKDNNVRIDWSTASEVDNDYFVVERSTDAYHFEEIGREEGAGYSQSVRYYSITDRFPFDGISYYRLKQVDFDGKTTYFDIKMVDNNDGYINEHGLSVFPNPIMEHSTFNIGLEGFSGNTVQVKIQNMSGYLIYSDEVSISQERELIELDTNILNNSGMYVVSIFNNGRWFQHKFMFVK